MLSASRKARVEQTPSPGVFDLAFGFSFVPSLLALEFARQPIPATLVQVANPGFSASN